MAIKINLSDLMYLETTPEEILELGGIPGPRGFQGNDGPAGPTGPTGNAIVPSVDEVTGIMSFYEASTGTIPTPVLVRGPKGETGNNLEFTWNGTQLGVRQEGDVSYTYVELKGVKGDTGLTGLTGETGGVGATGPQGNPGKNIEYIWNGTQLGIRQEGEATYTYVDLKGPKGDTGDQGNQGIKGETGNDGRGIVSVIKTSGTGSPGTLDTYTITFSDATISTFQVYNGADGTGSGDMSKSVYDTTNNGIVDNAEKVSGFTVGKNVPGDAVFTDTVYEHPSTHSADIIVDGTTNKAYTATEKTKLAGIATSANNYVHPTTTGNKHIPSGGSANQVLKYSADGTAVWGDAPAGVTIVNNLTETVAGKALDATQGKALSDIVSNISSLSLLSTTVISTPSALVAIAIPSGYNTIKIVCKGMRTSYTAAGTYLYMRINGSSVTGNYYHTYMLGSSVTTSTSQASITLGRIKNTLGGYYYYTIDDVLTTQRTIFGYGGAEYDRQVTVGYYNLSTAITQVSFFDPGSGANLTQGTIEIWGM